MRPGQRELFPATHPHANSEHCCAKVICPIHPQRSRRTSLEEGTDTAQSGGRVGTGSRPTLGDCRLPGRKYSHCGQRQTTKRTSLSVELGGNAIMRWWHQSQGMQIKPTVRHHCTPTTMAQNQKIEKRKCWQACAGTSTGENVKYSHYCGKELGSSSKR